LTIHCIVENADDNAAVELNQVKGMQGAATLVTARR